MSLRIASLVPSGTDLVAALGLESHLVGVSHECDHPAAAGLPVLTRANVPAAPAADPATVDGAVSAALRDGASLYVADRARLADLAPDLVVSQDICDVCAVEGTEARRALPPGATLVMLSAITLEGLAADLRRLGAAAGRPERAEAEVDRLAAHRQAIGARPAPGRRPRIVMLEWGDPPFLGGHWVPELVEAAGGDNVLASPGQPSRRSTWEAIRGAEPDVAVYVPCGYSLDEAAAEAASLAPLEALGVPVVATDATRLFSRCTPAAVRAALALLAAVVRGEPIPPADGRLVSAR